LRCTAARLSGNCEEACGNLKVVKPSGYAEAELETDAMAL
jgi:hypothetical protein